MLALPADRKRMEWGAWPLGKAPGAGWVSRTGLSACYAQAGGILLTEARPGGAGWNLLRLPKNSQTLHNAAPSTPSGVDDSGEAE